ncbi:MAG: hypothetical protein IPP33_09905 [Flavobacteriales bacterium]|nr:hypothetical protein [Flavobacteriales bacterium]
MDQYVNANYIGPMAFDRFAERDERSWEWALFLLVSLCSLHSSWVLNYVEPYEFLRGRSDDLGYYQWLPSVFVDHQVDYMRWVYKVSEGKALSMYTMGVALLQLPFYGIGHFSRPVWGIQKTGFHRLMP